MMVKAVLQDCGSFSFQKNDKDETDWQVIRGTYRPEDGTYLCVNKLGRKNRFRCDSIVYRKKTW